MKNKFLLIITLFTGLFLNSCNDYLNINEDPSFPQVAEGYALLPSIHANMVRASAWDSRYVGQYVQYWTWVASGNNWDRHGYVAGSDACGEYWRAHYFGLGTNIDLIIADGEKNNRPDYTGAAKAVRAWSWQGTTDMHGEVILKQAFEPNRYVFDFDPQPDVYAEVVKLCNEALVELDKTGYAKSLSRGDLVYKGDTEKWKKFVYGILARNMQNQSLKSSYNADKVIEFVDKAMASNADNFAVPHAATGSTDANFYGPLRNNMGSWRQSSYIIRLMDGSTFDSIVDPRISIMFTASPDGVFRGVAPSAGDPNNTTNNVRRIPNLWGALAVVPTAGKWIFNNNTPHQIMTYYEMQFLKAEAAFIKNNATLAYDAFIKGVGAHLDFVGVSAAAKNTFLKSKAIPQSAASLKLTDIMLQKYIALYAMNSLETWTDMRRYDYSTDVYLGITFPTSLFPDNQGNKVQRVRPRFNSEYVWNLKSLEVIGGNNADYHTKKVWFSEK